MDTLAARFRAALADLPVDAGDRAIAAVSGGPDSLVLADLLHRTRSAHRMGLVVGHVDHGIAPQSDVVSEQVAAFARERGMGFEVRRLQLGAGAGETEARHRRYAALEQIRSAADARWIVTAHHADDQAETVLMRALHGSGPAGLAGMLPVRGRILRPLLAFSRAELAAHATRHGLTGWTDPANTDPRHERAWLRAAVLPLLRSRVPDVVERLGRVAAQAAGDRAAWDALLDAMPELAIERDDCGISVAAPPLGGYDSRLAATLVRAAARRVGIVVGPARADRLLALARRGRSGATMPLGGGARAEVSFGRLRLLPGPGDAVPAGTVVISGSVPGEARWGRWRLRWSPDPAPAAQSRNGMSAWFVVGSELRVRAWRPGDRLHPLGGTGRRLLVRCFQDARVPRGRRGDWPVIDSAGQVVWVPGVCRARELVPAAGLEALRVDVAYA